VNSNEKLRSPGGGGNPTSDRINRAADVGADLGLLFPRNPAEAEKAPKVCKLPLVYVMSRGNRGGRPIFTRQDMEQMGYVACIEAQVMLLPAFIAQQKVLKELRATGGFTRADDQAISVASRL
jgi:2-methylisocitrate lyase-like PEP mutase family enzyme